MGWARTVAWLKVRTWFYLGWPGSIGLVLVLLAPTFAWQAWHAHLQRLAMVMPEVKAPLDLPQQRTDAMASQAKFGKPALPHLEDAPEILKVMQQTSRSRGLAWPLAEYRYVPIQKEALATMDIQTSVKGGYPQIKAWMQDVLKAAPAVAIRDLTLERPNADASVADAKVRWTVYLQDGWLQPADEERR